MRDGRRCRAAMIVTWMLAAISSHAGADEPSASLPPSDDALAQQLSNPVADLASLPLQFNWENGVGPNDDLRFVMNFQPVVPFHLTESWNLIGRMILPYINQPSLAPGAPATSGTSDILLSGFLSPAKSSGLIWGVGPAVSMPTTSDPTLGSGKWGIGPTVLILNISGPWTYGVLTNHIWSFANTGDIDRDSVSNTFIQPFFARQFPHAITLTLQSESTYNWKADGRNDWTVPVNLIVSKVTKLGSFPMSLGFGGGYYVESPEIGPDWKLRAVVTWILPGKK